MNNIMTYRVWRPWADVRMFSRRYAAICVRHLQEWSFRHSSTVGVVVAPERLSTERGSLREVSSSNTGEINSGGPAAGRKKTDFEDEIDGLGAQLHSPAATRKLPQRGESPSGEEVEERTQRRRRWSPTPVLLPLKSARRTTPEDAAHRWRRNVGKIS